MISVNEYKQNINSKRDTNSLDLTGLVVNHLTVLRKTSLRYKSSVVWECECACGSNYFAPAHRLKAGIVKSCGCKSIEGIKKAQTKHGGAIIGNGENRYTYVAWLSMKQRCLYPKHKSFNHYGAKGIRICNEWLDYQCFVNDMGIRPQNHTLGRIDNSKGYFKENCRWETQKQQANNRSDNRVIEFDGKKQTLQQWADQTGIKSCTIYKRIKSGWSIEKALTTKTRGKND